MMDNSYEFIVCDNCGQENTTVIYTNKDWKQPDLKHFALLQCNNCNLVYLNPRPTATSLKKFYSTDYKPYRKSINDERSPFIHFMRSYKIKKRRKIIEKYSGNHEGTLLDVGCATGIFLNEMKQAGWQVQGVELIKSAAEYARTNFNLDIFQGFLEDAPFSASSFDVITYWDVLEHTLSPSKTLKESLKLLSPEGLLVINIPNWKSLDRFLFGPHWIGIDPPRHLYAFPKDVLNSMLSNSGFDVIDWVCFIPSYFSSIISLEQLTKSKSPSISRILSRMLNLPGIRFIFEPYYLITNRLKLSGLITVFARKSVGDTSAC